MDCRHRYLAGVLLLIGMCIISHLYYLSQKELHVQELRACPPPELIPGLGAMNVSKHASITEAEAIRKNPTVEKGGFWKPPDCIVQQNVAIIVPYRNREKHLWVFLNHMHHFLQKQLRRYRIYIIEQTDKLGFNRAKLFNIGYLEASKDEAWDTFIFHDVDLLPTNTRNIYACSQHPRHMSVAVDKLGYRLYYEGQFGGVSCMSKKDFLAVNGYSNAYFGWGGEDDDIATRMNLKGLKRVRYPPEVSRYVMLSHKSQSHIKSKSSILLQYTKSLMDYDGLSTTNYTVIASKRHPLFTKITVDFKDEIQEFLKVISAKKMVKIKWKPNHGARVSYEDMKW